MAWYVLDGFTGGAVVAFVRNAGWPVSTAWLAAVVGAVAGVIVGRRRNRQAHQRAATTAAADLGLTYTETVTRPDAKLPCFTHWEKGRNGVNGVIDGVPVTAFDLTERIPGDESDTVRERAVVLMPAAGLPAFSLSPRGRVGWVADVFGIGGMRFDPAGAAPHDAPVVRQFGRAFRLDPTNATPTLLPDHTPTTDPVRRLFTPTLMAVLLDHTGWSFQGDGEWLAVLRGVRPEVDRGEWLTAAVAVRAALLAAANPPAEGLPPPPTRTAGQNAARILGTLVGAVLGLFGGFFGCAPLAMGNGFILLPFLGAAGGGLAGGLIGFALGVTAGRLPAMRNMRLVAPAEHNRRGIRWVQGGGCLGFFAGFFGGFGAFIALNELVIGRGGMNAGWLALFPILSLGGAAAGAVVGGFLVSRIVRRTGNPTEK